MICSNPRFYCLTRISSKPNGMNQLCECGHRRHDIGSVEGARLKVLREKKGKVFSASQYSSRAGINDRYINKDADEAENAIRYL